MYTRPETCPPDKVLATQFLYVRESDSKILGMIQIRHYLNELLERWGGHIGYSVRPSERRKGYAKAMLAAALDYCKTDLELTRVMVSCNTDNEASRRTILANGGVYENTVWCEEEQAHVERYWITL